MAAGAAAHAADRVRCWPAGLLHLVLWQVSEPPTLFSDLYKAYFPAAEVLWDDGLSASFPFTEMGAGGFVNVPVLAWLFVPLVPLGEDGRRLGVPGDSARRRRRWPACCCDAWRAQGPRRRRWCCCFSSTDRSSTACARATPPISCCWR